jgi:hypothetical protein
MDKDTWGKIYIFKEEDTSYYKIGFTSKELPQVSRGYTLQTGNPRQIKLLGFWEGTLQDELDLHDTLKSFRSRYNGEWYDLNVAALVQAICFTRATLLRPDKQSTDTLEDLESYGHVTLNQGPFQNMTGFYSEYVSTTYQDFHPSYVDLITQEDFVSEGSFYGCLVFIHEIATTVTVPLKCLSAT